ncbi:beta-galactosidase [Clostridium sp. Marseille-P2415]|uniref:beta-galactosidase n=1 Tax=Clostridium sp. Marseille-P2415 TaxID=1805471 RepID=UPI0009884720|nr:beta-galactosidase [Clostridium sp. Marseille-P2415]
MRQELLFGTAYYPEYMPYDRVEKDISMMQAAGMNVIRIAESTWSTLEPKDGKFDFFHIDRVLDAAERAGMKVIIGTPTYAVPSWLEKKDRDVMVTAKEGQARYGRRQIMDIMNPTFRFHAERVIRKLLLHTADHPCVIGFQIDNETKHYGTAGKAVQALFKEYLKETFVTTDRLNETFGLAYWSNSINGWDDFPDIRGCINGGLSCEFERFQRKLAAEYLCWQSEIVGEYKREDQFITHNFDFQWKKFGAEIAQDGYSYGVQPDMDHYEASKAVTIAGADIYHPTQDQLTGAETAFCGDAIRSLKDRNYLVLECQAQAFKYWTPYPGQLKLHAYSHLASGADGILYWNWHSIHNGYETYWKGLLSHDLEANPAYEEACRIGAEWKEAGQKLLHLQKDNKIALVVDIQSLHALEWFPIDRDLSYNDVVRWMYDCLYEMNMECDVVEASALDPGNYKMIVTPALYSASEDTLKKLKRFVSDGGVLISSFKSFVSNEFLSVYHDTQPHILHECFGIRYNQFTEPGKMTIKGRPVTYFAELVEAGEAEVLASYEHKYWGKYAGITRADYKKGSAYYIACYTHKDIVKEVCRRAVRDAGLEDEIPEACWPVIIRSGENEEKKKMHYVLHYRDEDSALACPYHKVKSVLDGMSYKKGDRIPLKDWDVVILEEEV